MNEGAEMTHDTTQAAASSWHYERDVEGIGWLTIDTPGASVNTLGRATIADLEVLIDRIEAEAATGDLLGVALLSGKPGGFIAGADISEFDTMADPAILGAALRRTHALFDRIEALKVPIVAGIHGFCLGGGLELALACRYRIAVDDEATRLGFPEVNLGIFPGFGGTGRSIRQAGPVPAMQLMLTGKPVRARAAKRMGLVDLVVRHRDMLRWAARKAILDRSTSPVAPWSQRLLAFEPIRKRIAERMRREAGRKARPEHYPAPYALIDLFEAHGDNWREMVRGEAAGFVPLMASPTASNLRRVFFLSEALKKQGLRGEQKPEVRRVHVSGAGVVGGDIADWCALRGLGVTLQDLDMERIRPALDRARALFKKRLKSKTEIDTAVARLEADPLGKGLARADVVIEAVVERLDVKQAVFATAEALARPGAILATTTASIELERIAEGLSDPTRLIGLHFFNPVAQLPLVEVIRSRFNTDQQMAMGASFALAIGKSPVVARSAPGFLVNRVLMPYLLGAVERVEAGASPEQIDAAAVAFGMPMGPIELMDTVGLDIGRSVASELGHAVPDGSRFARLVAEGKLGRKSGEGFYRWEKGKPNKAEAPPHADLAGLGRDLVKPLVDEAERAVAAGIVGGEDLADIGVILGTGFAPFLGGPLKARRDGRA